MTHGRAWLLGTLLLVTPLIGCIGASNDAAPQSTDGVEETVDWLFEDFIVGDHDHSVPDNHEFQAPTMHHSGYNVLSDDGVPYTYLGELDTRNNRTAVAVVGQGSVPGFVLLDTSDPANPVVVNRAELPYAYLVDVKLSHDAQYIFAATQQVTTGRAGTPTAESVQDGTYLAKNGIAIYHRTDADELHFIGFQPVEATGCHMLSVHAHVDNPNNPFVWCIGQTLTTFQFLSDTGTMVPLSTYAPFGTDYQETVLEKGSPTGVTPHDMTFQKDPIDGTDTLVVSHWDAGVRVLDVSDKANPQEIFAWSGQGAEHYQGYVHSAMMTELDGKRILVVTPETLSDILPAVWVLDVTDFESPELVAEWTNPGGHTSQGLLMTTHQFQLVDGKMYMTYNHNGVWILDLATMIANGGGADDHSEILGVILPRVDVEPGRDSTPLGVPAIWDLNVVNGYILATDRYTGLHVMHYAPDAHTPEMTSFA